MARRKHSSFRVCLTSVGTSFIQIWSSPTSTLRMSIANTTTLHVSSLCYNSSTRHVISPCPRLMPLPRANGKVFCSPGTTLAFPLLIRLRRGCFQVAAQPQMRHGCFQVAVLPCLLHSWTTSGTLTDAVLPCLLHSWTTSGALTVGVLPILQLKVYRMDPSRVMSQQAVESPTASRMVFYK